MKRSGSLPAADYAQLLGEQARPDSHAKDAAGESGPFLTGALARARLDGAQVLQGVPSPNSFGIHGNNIAQIREIDWALQRVGQLLDILLDDDRREPLQGRSAA